MTNPFLLSEFEIRWSLREASKLSEGVDTAIAISTENIEKIINLPDDEVSYQTTFLALEHATDLLDNAWGEASHLSSVCDSEALRAAYNENLGKVSAFYSSLGLNEDLWASLKRFAEKKAEITQLTAIQQRHVAETSEDFISAGIDLPKEEKERIREINAELSELTKTFSEKVLDSTNAWELILDDASLLAGVPQSHQAALQQDVKNKNPDNKDLWRISAQATSYRPVLMNAENEALREKVWRGICTVGSIAPYDTSDEIRKILVLRQEKAKLLGKDNFADLVTKRRMTGSGAKALHFVEDLHQKIHAQFLQENEALLAYKNQEGFASTPSSSLEPWNVAYWSEHHRKAAYNFDDESLRPYFAVDQVMKGMFELCSELFAVSFKEKSTQFLSTPDETPESDKIEVWHEDVKFYEIYDEKTKAHLGSFYADWHPRESKRGGAWMNQLRVGSPAEGIKHLGLIVGNMTKPVGDQPALLTHEEVETIFHEFGHLLHLLLSEVPIPSLAGTNVSWDFVELPSQLMENFCWNRKTLDTFAKHHETGEPIPDELFDKMLKARNYRSATNCMRQLGFSKLDLELHSNANLDLSMDLDALDQSLVGDYKIPLSEPSPTILRQFGHLFSDATGYAAGYYSYKWAEVLDADAFTKFEENGVLSPSIGLEFRKEILSQGNAHPANELFKNFRGRDPELLALLKRSGLNN